MNLLQKKTILGLLGGAFLLTGIIGASVSEASSYHDKGQYHNNIRHEQDHFGYHHE